MITGSLSEDYSLSVFDITFDANGKKGQGTLYPAVKVSIDEQGQISLETYGDKPWALNNLTDKVKK